MPHGCHKRQVFVLLFLVWHISDIVNWHLWTLIECSVLVCGYCLVAGLAVIRSAVKHHCNEKSTTDQVWCVSVWWWEIGVDRKKKSAFRCMQDKCRSVSEVSAFVVLNVARKQRKTDWLYGLRIHDDMMTWLNPLDSGWRKTQLADFFQSHYMELCAFIELSCVRVELEVMNC